MVYGYHKSSLYRETIFALCFPFILVCFYHVKNLCVHANDQELYDMVKLKKLLLRTLE